MASISSRPVADGPSGRVIPAAALSTLAAPAGAQSSSGNARSSQGRATVPAFRKDVLSILRSDFPAAAVTSDDDDPEHIVLGRFVDLLGNIRRSVAGLKDAQRHAAILRPSSGSPGANSNAHGAVNLHERGPAPLRRARC
ncbi:hypothetical protein [Methylobacterium sp. Leaf399]|uniref:hypothetical protein n=1 Tax=Methylobacterium sp. Leaf399 TaxID=1736364 RepID=UPI000AC03822|nr:hypothetical protein [Methylobacterium sp. Leaf399]